MNVQELSLVCLAVLVLAAAAQASPSGDLKVRIGISRPMKFMPGEQIWCAAALAVNEINGPGGINVKGQKYK